VSGMFLAVTQTKPSPTECSFRANRKNVANDQHANHKHRIDRRSPKPWIMRRKLGMHPGEVENPAIARTK